MSSEENSTPLLRDADVDEDHEAKAELSEPDGAQYQLSTKPEARAREDMSIMGIPRDTIEEMMRAWSKILIQGLRNQNLHVLERGDDVELGPMPTVSSPRPVSIDRIENSGGQDGTWDGRWVQVMSEDKIQQENEQREKTTWNCTRRGNSPVDCWTDSWYGRDSRDPAAMDTLDQFARQQQWPGTTADMLKLQFELRALLKGKSIWENGPMLLSSPDCHMAFIGIRLRNLPFSEISHVLKLHGLDEIVNTDVSVYVKILVEYLYLYRDKRASEEVTVNILLYKCYARGILSQGRDDFESEAIWSLLATNIYVLLRAMNCVDIWGLCPDLTNGYPTLFPSKLRDELEGRCNQERRLEENALKSETVKFLNLSPWEIMRQSQAWNDMWRRGDQDDPVSGEEVKGGYFQKDELDASLLQSVGGLHLVWTSCKDDHLRLFSAAVDGTTILKLYWFEYHQGTLLTVTVTLLVPMTMVTDLDPTVFPQLIEYFSDYRVLFCHRCKSVYFPSQLDRHLATRHHIEHKRRQPVVAYCQTAHLGDPSHNLQA
ncbi:hypothetical protein DL98DRAFT_599130 [Cadophora sp. DSE1049]|nr:hypothetical protein DL98DRAFT_599130 [Cadophora sp. DSE1049]